jgi:hypothetical protein
MLVIYFDDDYLDLMAENLKVKARMTGYNVRKLFNSYASELFLSFDAATTQHVMMTIFRMYFDL